MEICLKVGNNNFSFLLNQDDTVEELKEKILKTKIRKIPHSCHSFELFYNVRHLENDKKLSYYKIIKWGCLLMRFDEHSIGGGFIDNLKRESQTQIAKKIGFDMNLLKREELPLNLIYFDSNLTEQEKYKYFNNFKVNVVGGFYAMDDVNILKKLLQKIAEKNIPFLVVSSGNSTEEIISICKEYSFIKEIIIFCKVYESNTHYINKYPGYIKKIVTSIGELYDYLKEFFNKEVCYE